MLKFSIAVLLIVKACLLVVECSSESELLIYPNQNHILAPTKEPLIITCEAKARDEDKKMDEAFNYEGEKFTNMKWLNEYGVEITENVTKTESMIRLTFSKPSVEDSGTYKCKAVYPDLFRIMEAQVFLDFYEPITIEDCPETQYLIIGESGHIRCRVFASSMPIIIWKKDGSPINSEQIIVDTFVLKIPSVAEENMGTYTAEAFVKETGENLLRSIHVNVISPPKITHLPEEFTVIQGKSSTIKCEASGPEPLNYTWYNYRFENLSDSNIMASYGHKVDQGLLTISKVTRFVGEFYVCEVSNPAGKDRALVKINIQRSEICNETCEGYNVPIKLLPETKGDLKRICTIGTKKIKCRIQTTEICYGVDVTNHRSLKIDYDLLSTYQDLYCTENTLFHAVLVDNMKCFRKIADSNISRQCYTDDVSIIESFAQKIAQGFEEEGLISDADYGSDTDKLHFCIKKMNRYACHALKIEAKCGTVAMYVYSEIIQKDSSLQRMCPDFSHLLPTVIRLHKKEDEN